MDPTVLLRRPNRARRDGNRRGRACRNHIYGPRGVIRPGGLTDTSRLMGTYLIRWWSFPWVGTFRPRDRHIPRRYRRQVPNPACEKIPKVWRFLSQGAPDTWAKHSCEHWSKRGTRQIGVTLSSRPSLTRSGRSPIATF